MNVNDLPSLRLRAQHIALSTCKSPLDVVGALGAMQAQDRAAALWAVGLRLPGSTASTVESALAQGTLVRTWPMRGTLHLVPACDVHWMLGLLTARVVKGSAGRAKQLKLDDSIIARASDLLVRALKGDRQLTRTAVMDLLEQEGISTQGQRGYHIVWRLAQQGVLCLGLHEDKQPSFVLLDEHVPKPVRRSLASPLAELTYRYFSSHGPATVQDYAHWSGLKLSEARQGIELLGSRLESQVVEGVEHWQAPHPRGATPAEPPAFLLPGFDEYLLGYKDRGAVLPAQHANHVVPGGNGMFLPMMVLHGQIVGTWKRVLKTRGVEVNLAPFGPLRKKDTVAFAAAAEAYGAFLEVPLVR